MIVSAAKRAITDIENNKFLHFISVVTIALSVFIVSAFSLFFNNATDFLDAWRSGVRITAYLNDNVPELQRTELMEKVRNSSGVSAIQFISKDDAYNDLHEKIGQQSSLLDGLDKNPLPDSIEITLADSYRQIEDIEKLAKKIRELPHVEDVEYAQKWLYRFNGIYNLFKVTGMVLVSIFFIATFLIIANTIRLIMYSRREEIEIIRIIGADEAFIKYPLFFEAMAQGFLGGVAGILMLYLSFMLTVPNFAPDMVFSFFEIRFISVKFSLAIVSGSMMIGWIGCFFSIRKFLKL
ncbi:MAG: permease-like cell division protein FtsX [Desulfobacteraceae bacterium]|jgi:cell division transport system permease protein|nr:permease-like cell division protein FtsX [Desulfobacteraceae bacterium]